MAVFASLFSVGEVLRRVLIAHLDPAITATDVVIGVPPELPDGATRQVRLSLLYTNPQGTHRNDPRERGADGSEVPPPVTLSAYYLVTTYGYDTQQNGQSAHQTLGNVIQVFHSFPIVTLPLVPGPGLGEGRLSIAQLPSSPEQMEKLFSMMQLRHRPWALFEVGPIQLVSLVPTPPPRPVVRPDGLVLGGPTVRTPPVLAAVTPAAIAPGARLRLDGAFSGTPAAVTIGSTRIASGITVIDPGSALTVTLPANLPIGLHEVQLASASPTGELYSNARTVRVVAATVPTLQAPALLRQSIATPLALDGSALAATQNLVAWRDAGIRSPADVVRLATQAVTATRVSVAPAELAKLKPGKRYRVAAQVSAGQYTPFVLLDITP